MLAFVVAAQPTKSRRLYLLRDKQQSESRRPVDRIEKINGRAVAGSAAEECSGSPRT